MYSFTKTKKYSIQVYPDSTGLQDFHTPKPLQTVENLYKPQTVPKMQNKHDFF